MSDISSMRWKLREQGDIGVWHGVYGDASDWHGQHLSLSVVAMCRGCGGGVNVMKEDNIEVSKVLWDDGWLKKLGGQSWWLKLLLVATYSICGSVVDGREKALVAVLH